MSCRRTEESASSSDGSSGKARREENLQGLRRPREHRGGDRNVAGNLRGKGTEELTVPTQCPEEPQAGDFPARSIPLFRGRTKGFCSGQEASR